MASNYTGFPVTYETEAGAKTSVGAGVEVHVYNTATSADVAESPLFTDSNGEIASGSFAAVTVGSKVHFRVENFNGMAFSASQITT